MVVDNRGKVAGLNPAPLPEFKASSEKELSRLWICRAGWSHSCW